MQAVPHRGDAQPVDRQRQQLRDREALGGPSACGLIGRRGLDRRERVEGRGFDPPSLGLSPRGAARRHGAAPTRR